MVIREWTLIDPVVMEYWEVLEETGNSVYHSKHGPIVDNCYVDLYKET